jgi:ferredoxin
MEQIPANLEAQVRHAVQSCPKAALSLEDDAGHPMDA